METRDQFFEITPNSTMEALSEYGGQFAYLQRGVPWWIGDLARYAEARWPEEWYQVFPEWISPGLVERCKGVAKAYPNEADRNSLATWTQHMKVASKPDRVELVAAMIAQGLTSDESRKDIYANSEDGKPRWLLAVDVNYHLHRHWYSGAGVEAAKQVCDWVGRMVERLKEKGLTDVVACFDSPNNFRKALTKEWADEYKPRPPKPPELIQQLQLVRTLLDDSGFRCAAVDTFEADDLMASYAVQFTGKVTLLAQDKDMKQCLSETCNMLLDVEWNEDPTSGDMIPDYQWLSAKQHIEATGIQPNQWADYQAIAGDNVDGIKGAIGIGEVGANKLIAEFGSLLAVLQAAVAEDERITPKNRTSFLTLPEDHPFAEHVDIVRQLVTLRTDVRIPNDTRI
jgi:5'-3' exonuclease